VLERAEPALAYLADAEADLAARRELRAGRVRLAAFESALASIVAGGIAAFRDDHPGVRVEIVQAEPAEALAMLNAGTVDVALEYALEDPPPAGGRLRRRLLLRDELRAVLPRAHPLASRRSLELADLAAEGFLAPRAEGFGAGYRRFLARLAAGAGFTPRIAYETDDLQVAQAFAAAGLGVVLMHELTMPVRRPDVAVLPLRGSVGARGVWAATVRGRRLPAADGLIAAIERAALYPPIA
jgi:DNA-binding transcriptional LysR family regulator